MSAWRTLGLFIGVAACLYAALVALMYTKQRSLLFYPQMTRHPPLAPGSSSTSTAPRCAAGW